MLFLLSWLHFSRTFAGRKKQVGGPQVARGPQVGHAGRTGTLYRFQPPLILQYELIRPLFIKARRSWFTWWIPKGPSLYV